MSEHRRTLSISSRSFHDHPPSPRSPSPPVQIHHTPIIQFPTTSLVESVAGAAHYSGVRLDPESPGSPSSPTKRRLGSMDSPEIHTEVNHRHDRVLADLKELYCCHPTLAIFDRSWHRDAVFEDPLSKCKGFHEYAAQWFAMPKFFSKSETIATRVMSSTSIPNRLVYSQTQEYTIRWLNRKTRIDSIIVVDLDGDDKIIRLSDQWSGKALPTRYGANLLRILNAKVAPWLFHVPKENA